VLVLTVQDLVKYVEGNLNQKDGCLGVRRSVVLDDRYTEFVSGQHATALKNVSLAKITCTPFPGAPVIPIRWCWKNAQTAACSSRETNDFRYKSCGESRAPSSFSPSWLVRAIP